MRHKHCHLTRELGSGTNRDLPLSSLVCNALFTVYNLQLESCVSLFPRGHFLFPRKYVYGEGGGEVEIVTIPLKMRSLELDLPFRKQRILS